MDSHVKHIGKTRKTEEKRREKDRERIERIRAECRDEGEKTANWQVRRRTSLLDWTGLESNTH